MQHTPWLVTFLLWAAVWDSCCKTGCWPLPHPLALQGAVLEAANVLKPFRDDFFPIDKAHSDQLPMDYDFHCADNEPPLWCARHAVLQKQGRWGHVGQQIPRAAHRNRVNDAPPGGEGPQATREGPPLLHGQAPGGHRDPTDQDADGVRKSAVRRLLPPSYEAVAVLVGGRVPQRDEDKACARGRCLAGLRGGVELELACLPLTPGCLRPGIRILACWSQLAAGKQWIDS